MRRFGVFAVVALLSPGSAAAAVDSLTRAEPLVRIAPAAATRSLGTRTFALVELDHANGAAAEVSLALAGGRVLSRQLAIWRVPGRAAAQVVPELARAGLVRAAQPDLPVQLHDHLVGGDPLLPTQWWVPVVGADRAEPPAGPGKPVTVIDAGLDQTHPEFAGRPDTEPLNVQDLGTFEGYFHGTAVSSVVGAPTNAQGLVGVYPKAAIRSFDAVVAGVPTTGDVIAGIDASIRRGPGVINLSLGVVPTQLFLDVVNAAFGTGSLLVASSGNDRLNGSRPAFPAVLPHVLTIAASDQSGAATFFSSATPALDLTAPGQDIPVAVPTSFNATGYDTFDGTSFSAPIVAGAAAWAWTVRPNLDVTQMHELMRRATRDVQPAGRDNDTGFGMLDIPLALTIPAPASDGEEPNDDIDHVKAGGLFREASAPLTAPGRGTRTIGARLDRTEDPEDVYRVWVPARRSVVLTLRTNANAQLAIWGPKTRTVFAEGAALRRNLVDASLRTGTKPETVRATNKTRRGAFYYGDVFLARGVKAASYRLSVRTVRP